MKTASSPTELEASPDINQTIDDYNKPVTCSTGGEIMLDSALFYLWKLAQTYPLEQAISIRSKSVEQPDEVGRLALEVLARADVLPQITATPVIPPVNLSFPPSTAPIVSVIIVNRSGRHYLAACLPSKLSPQKAKNMA